MSRAATSAEISFPDHGAGEPGRWLNLGSLVLGVAFTLGLMAGIAYFETRRPDAPPDEIEDLRALSIPLETPPPPRPREPVTAPEEVAPLAGLEIGSSDSPVKIAVLPPEFDALMPPAHAAPSATIQAGQFHANLKPRTELTGDLGRVFLGREVDSIPTVIYRSKPAIPRWMRQDVEVMRLVVLLVTNTTGTVDSVRVLQSSGNPDIDKIIVRGVKNEWTFTPAIKKGRKVKCLLQQSIVLKWSGGSPFVN